MCSGNRHRRFGGHWLCPGDHRRAHGAGDIQRKSGDRYGKRAELATTEHPNNMPWAPEFSLGSGRGGEQAPHTQVSDSGQWRARPCHRPVRHSDFTRWNSLEDSGSVSQNKTKKISIYTKHPLVTQKARITSKMPGIVLQWQRAKVQQRGAFSGQLSPQGRNVMMTNHDGDSEGSETR